MKTLIITLIFFFPFLIFAQNVGVNDDGSTPHTGAILDVNSSDKGILIPRLESSAVATPVEGMLIYQPSDQSFYFFKSFLWHKVYSGTSPDGPSFETISNLVRSNGNTDNENFIFGRDSIPGFADISDKFIYYNQSSGAFRGGEVENSQAWSPINLGSNSFAYGKNVKADSPSGVALGRDIEVNSSAVGFAIGYQDTVTANLGSGALGRGNVVEGTSGNIAVGENNYINASSSNGAVAIGQGNSILAAQSAVVLGSGLTNIIDSAVFVGRNNSQFGYPVDLAFAVGNGKNEYDPAAPHQDGLVIRTNGYTGINNNIPTNALHIRTPAQKANEGFQ